ncbi:MAG: rRNA maturation RNase YbeY [Flavobacteriales bacterium]|nr:rRNA maturation RNase YbeY [Flavobacteriales bacterium]
MIEVYFEDVDAFDLDVALINQWLKDVAHEENHELGEVSMILCSDEHLLEMNRKHLDHDYYTDIITFDYTEEDVVSGDLFISIDRVKDNANTHKEMFHVELLRVMVHGVLHLLGYKDKSEEEQKLMREKENWALGLIVSRET